MKTYTFNGSEFTASDNILRIHNIAIPLQRMFNEKLKEYSKGIAIDEVNLRKSELDRLKSLVEVDREYLSEIEDNPNQAEEIKRVKNQLAKNSKIYHKALDIFNADEKIKETAEKYTEAINLTFKHLITEDEIVIPFLEKYLTGDFEKLDYTNPEILKFISEVVSDFFFKLSQSKTK